MRDLVIGLTALGFAMASVPVVAIAKDDVAVVQKDKKINCQDGEIWHPEEKKCVKEIE